MLRFRGLSFKLPTTKERRHILCFWDGQIDPRTLRVPSIALCHLHSDSKHEERFLAFKRFKAPKPFLDESNL